MNRFPDQSSPLALLPEVKHGSSCKDVRITEHDDTYSWMAADTRPYVFRLLLLRGSGRKVNENITRRSAENYTTP